MKIILQKEDYIKAMTPFLNGCKFRGVISADGDVGITFGCYLLYRLLGGFNSDLMREIEKNGVGDKDNKILWGLKPFDSIEPDYCSHTTTYENDFVKEELKRDIMAIEPCKHCGGLLLKKLEDLK